MTRALALLLAALLTATADARIPRSAAEVKAFRTEHPCPSTGRIRGPCVGWQVDHVIPLKCGGPDAVANMQWLTVEAHKAKTAREAAWCRRQIRRE